MFLNRRVTLRCICEDLTTDWASTSAQRSYLDLREAVSERDKKAVAKLLTLVPSTSLIDHPLIKSFHSAFAETGTEVKRESISGFTEPHWWKQKSGRWRGAATDSRMITTLRKVFENSLIRSKAQKQDSIFQGTVDVWLCAGGLRADGEERDFYQVFPSIELSCLPTGEDFFLQKTEQDLARLQAWREQLMLALYVCFLEAYDTDPTATNKPIVFHVPQVAPTSSPDAIVHLEFEVIRVSDDQQQLEELLIKVQTENYSDLHRVATNTFRALFQNKEDEWDVSSSPFQKLEIWSVLIQPELVARARDIVQAGSIPVDLRSAKLIQGLRAHYTHKNEIVAASITGNPIRALCGAWFVPTRDPNKVSGCPQCQSIFNQHD
ncbi:DUF3039 domain-containing protein [Jonesiaceae bacterium BS-20]|uniref:DUF3039 domain-containing protein n=1 Tax=Jonesiaceae bacterium BS-20 TaxID=3120821 RepID=A0AAU7DY53_9MICO